MNMTSFFICFYSNIELLLLLVVFLFIDKKLGIINGEGGFIMKKNHRFKRLLVLLALCLPLVFIHAFAVTNPINEMAPNSTETGLLTKNGTHAVEYWLINLDT